MTMTVASRWLFGGVVLSQLLSLAAAVDLRLYNTDYSCNGNRLICSNIPQQTCCVPRVEYYYSASCLNCDSGMTHYGWQRDGGIGCSRVVVSRRGGSNNCIQEARRQGLNETVSDAQKDDFNSTVLPPFLVTIRFQWLHAPIHDSV
ncbi:hypothetical protein HYQ46_013217 [Verticillium longisporum]|nr:hypothetical protein HYQ44_019077 [Verticillium longisporum]KAG7151039.1 hypothetical protein HYQ46_013217 [Verticillium longisporum]